MRKLAFLLLAAAALPVTTEAAAKNQASKKKAPPSITATLSRASPALDEQGQVIQLAVRVRANRPLNRWSVRFYTRPPNETWTSKIETIQDGYSATDVEAAGLEWWAELLTDRGAVHSSLASQDHPFFDGKPLPEAPKPKPPASDAPVAVAPAPALNPVEKPPSIFPPHVRAKKVVRMSPVRKTGIGLAIGGVLAGGAGTFFGIQSRQARALLASPKIDDQGRQLSPNQNQAYQLDAIARSNALYANLLWGAGGALAVAGGICILVGKDVVVSPSPQGAVLSGQF